MWEKRTCEHIRLEPNEVHVWRFSLETSPARLSECERALSADELERAARFHFDRDRSRYVVARATVREVLGSYLELAPSAIRFRYNEFGKPALNPKQALEFNLSHSEDLAAIAVCQYPVGIDLERHKDETDLAIANRYFSAAEVSSLLSMPEGERRAAFFRCWTRKEAVIKALGEGLNFPLKEFTVSLGEDCMLLRIEKESLTVRNWTLLNLEFDDDFSGAVAVMSGQIKLSTFDFTNPSA